MYLKNMGKLTKTAARKKKNRFLETEDSKNKQYEKVRIRMSQIRDIGSATQRAEIL